jgi:hypothetical protein
MASTKIVSDIFIKMALRFCNNKSCRNYATKRTMNHNDKANTAFRPRGTGSTPCGAYLYAPLGSANLISIRGCVADYED